MRTRATIVFFSLFTAVLLTSVAHAGTPGSLSVIGRGGKFTSECPLRHTDVKAAISGGIGGHGAPVAGWASFRRRAWRAWRSRSTSASSASRRISPRVMRARPDLRPVLLDRLDPPVVHNLHGHAAVVARFLRVDPVVEPMALERPGCLDENHVRAGGP